MTARVEPPAEHRGVRRFEVRYIEGEDDETKPVPVLGWHDTEDGARRMAHAWRKRPSVTAAWVVDLRPAPAVNEKSVILPPEPRDE